MFCRQGVITRSRPRSRVRATIRPRRQEWSRQDHAPADDIREAAEDPLPHLHTTRGAGSGGRRHDSTTECTRM